MVIEGRASAASFESHVIQLILKILKPLEFTWPYFLCKVPPFDLLIGLIAILIGVTADFTFHALNHDVVMLQGL